MAVSEQQLQRLIQSPRETLDIELKEWINPETPEGIAKIARSCIALFNLNGGYLVIGFKNNGDPAGNGPADVRSTFHPDVVQRIVAKYASQPIAVTVEFAIRDGIEYPVICVPSGVRTPCAAKSDLKIGDRMVVRDHTVYVRSVSSNNTVSTTEPRIPDWDRLVKTCHDNREADIGAFFRRHLASGDLGALRDVLAPTPSAPSLLDRTVAFLDECYERFQKRIKLRQMTAENAATFEVSFLIQGAVPPHNADRDFLNRIQLNKPRHSGWDFWVDLSNSNTPSDRPYVDDGGWELLIDSELIGKILDFWRAEPSGRFYHLRNLEDDSHKKEGVPAHKYFDFALHTGRVAEAVSIASHIATAMGCEEDTTTLSFACRWRGISGRNLYSWSQPRRGFYSTDPSVQDKITTTATMPLISTAYSPTVTTLVAPVFALFGGWKFDNSVIEGIVREVVGRRM